MGLSLADIEDAPAQTLDWLIEIHRVHEEVKAETKGSPDA